MGLKGFVMVALLAAAACNGEQSTAADDSASFMPKVSPDDLAPLVGDDWEGELTYLDYGDNETQVTIPVELAVSQNDRVFDLYFSFPDEPQADGRAEVVISDNGRQLNDETLQRRIETDGGELMLTTEQPCQDGGTAAVCEFTYIIADDAFSTTKMVTMDDSDEAFRRNRYIFTRS